MKIVADTNIPFVTQLFSQIGEVVTVAGRDIRAEHVRDAEILLVRSVTRVDANLLAGSAVRFVGTATIGVDHIDLEYLQRQQIGFSSAPGCNAISAAEYVISALLVLAEHQHWDLFNKTVAIVGVGNVGGNLYRRLQSLGICCLPYDPPRQQALGDRDYVTWESVLSADIVTAHVPLTLTGEYPTRQMFDAAFFAKLKPGATFINTSRGAVVQEADLTSVLRQRDDLQLVLDVWANEPTIDTNLLQRTTIGTPHIAGYSLDGKVRGTTMIYQALCQYLAIDAVLPDDLLSSEVAHAEIHLHADLGLQDALCQVVPIAYDIQGDDTRLRQLIDMPEAARGTYFDRLRKEYPVRREFSNYSVVLSHKNPEMAEKLKGLDFKVKIED